MDYKSKINEKISHCFETFNPQQLEDLYMRN